MVKSQKMHNRLALVVETEKEKTQRKEFVFDDTKVKIPLCYSSDSIQVFWWKFFRQSHKWTMWTIIYSLHVFECVFTVSLYVNVYIKTYFQKREGFCQLLQQMKNKHSGKPEPDMITIFVGTWNMGKMDLAFSLLAFSIHFIFFKSKKASQGLLNSNIFGTEAQNNVI